MRTRIDRVLIDERLIEKATETTINKTIISDHDVITWTIETGREKMKSPYDRTTTVTDVTVSKTLTIRTKYESTKKNEEVV